MNKIIWKLRFAWSLHTRGYLPFLQAWGVAEEVYINSTDEDPVDAAFEEMGYWGEQ